jgi:hypothetical protein
MPTSEVKMYFLSKAKKDVVIKFVKVIDHIEDCEGFIQKQLKYFYCCT